MDVLKNLRFNNAGVAALKRYDDGKWGFIDKTGKLIVPFIYDDFIRLGFYGRSW